MLYSKENELLHRESKFNHCTLKITAVNNTQNQDNRSISTELTKNYDITVYGRWRSNVCVC